MSVQKINARPAGMDSDTTKKSLGWFIEFQETLKLAWPLIIAQLATMGISTTDVIMMGWLGPQELAAGTLATAVMFPFLLFGFGILGSVAPLVAQAIGAKEFRSVRRNTRQGLWLSVILCLFFIPILMQMQTIISFFGTDLINWHYSHRPI